MSDYTCPICSKTSPEVRKAAASTYCNECKVSRDGVALHRRLHPPEPTWDIELAYQWLYKLYNGYHVSSINPELKAEGFYLWGDEDDTSP